MLDEEPEQVKPLRVKAALAVDERHDRELVDGDQEHAATPRDLQGRRSSKCLAEDGGELATVGELAGGELHDVALTCVRARHDGGRPGADALTDLVEDAAEQAVDLLLAC